MYQEEGSKKSSDQEFGNATRDLKVLSKRAPPHDDAATVINSCYRLEVKYITFTPPNIPLVIVAKQFNICLIWPEKLLSEDFLVAHEVKRKIYLRWWVQGCYCPFKIMESHLAPLTVSDIYLPITCTPIQVFELMIWESSVI